EGVAAGVRARHWKATPDRPRVRRAVMIDDPLGTILIVFERSGRELERQVARDGDRAAAMTAHRPAGSAPGGRHHDGGRGVNLNPLHEHSLPGAHARWATCSGITPRSSPTMGFSRRPVLISNNATSRSNANTRANASSARGEKHAKQRV